MSSKSPILLALGALLVCSALGACKKNESKTTVPGSWRNPEHSDQTFSSFFVIGIGRNDARRRLYENRMVQALERHGAKAQASWSVFPDSEELNKEDVLAVVAKGGFDGVILTQVLGVDQQHQYVEGRTTYVPTSNVDLYMPDYDQKYDVVREPGYYETKTTFNVETVLYTADEGTKIWWALSETVNPDTVEEIIESVANAAADRMKADGLIR